MGIVTTSSETAFKFSPEDDLRLRHQSGQLDQDIPRQQLHRQSGRLPLKVGDTWEEGGEDGDKIFTWHLALAARPKLWTFSSVGRLGHRRDGTGGMEGRITVQYHFTQPGQDCTLFTRTMTIEAPKDAPMPDGFFRIVNPANIDRYHAAIARELESVAATG